MRSKGCHSLWRPSQRQHRKHPWCLEYSSLLLQATPGLPWGFAHKVLQKASRMLSKCFLSQRLGVPLKKSTLFAPHLPPSSIPNPSLITALQANRCFTHSKITVCSFPAKFLRPGILKQHRFYYLTDLEIRIPKPRSSVCSLQRPCKESSLNSSSFRQLLASLSIAWLVCPSL